MGTLTKSPRRSTRGAVVSTVLSLLVAWLPSAACGQAPASPAEPTAAGSGARSQIGTCECTADPGAPRKSCTTTSRACEAKCGNPSYSFQVLTRDVLKICPPRELFINLPFADGRPGAGVVTVTDKKSTTTLDHAYEADVDLDDDDEDAEEDLSEEETDTEFHAAIESRPLLPHRFTLAFPPGGSEPEPASAADYRALLDDLKSRPAYEIDITGHADTLADETANPELSVDRAGAMAAALVRDGIDPKAISIVPGYGKRAEAAPGDTPAEARLHSVEIRVR